MLLPAEHECHSDVDCPLGTPCMEPFSSNVIDQFSLTYDLRYQGGAGQAGQQGRAKKCYLVGPRTGGGDVITACNVVQVRQPVNE